MNLRYIGDSERGTICPNYPRYNGCLVEAKARLSIENELARITPLVESALITTA
ncbi:putative DNA-directed DNA polymerase [Helianthus annuus]|uniref:DNA-directed DNA polymerase n=1 Tax=Helianthus annuus TaxID=4232 RepID=A0A9K3IL84_HELAN|nr:putative DNA-directed DNA polymerase [Helianthus annuus]KAJ0550442.1 putative DNA-directed DNA polymerase [Helianthus annuus]KAJ0557170.1 putative DNA-directed DNA polymerase [Helianthus annuus]KAJ0563398.1 putative DNA-directed DNA polymerase [Helianthus annuus]KAJ0728734.1 putative DNA-directed DNA polymerase [Helianthus annuus]